MLRRVSVPRRWKFSVRYKSTNPHQSTSGLQSAFRARAVLQAIPAMDIRVAQLCNSDCTPAELKKTLLNYASPAYLKDVESINPNVAKTDLVNTARLVSELFITNMKGRGKQPPNVDIVLMVLKNLGKTEKRLVSKCLPEFVQQCLLCGHVDAAMSLYQHMSRLSITDPSICLDVRGLEQLGAALVQDARIDDVKRLLLNTPFLTERLLVLAAEPLIMAGQLNWFTSISFKQFLQKMPPPSSVSRVIRSIVKGRARRHMSQTETSENEMKALKKLFAFLEKYHEKVLLQGDDHDGDGSSVVGVKAMGHVIHYIDATDAGAAGATTAEIAATSEAASFALSSSSSSSTDGTDGSSSGNGKGGGGQVQGGYASASARRVGSRIDSLPYLSSSFAARQLYEMERYVMKLEKDKIEISPEEAFFLRITPKFESTHFPFVTEDRHVDFSYESGGLEGMEINDITEQLRLSRPNDFLLMSGSLFTLGYSFEMRQLRQRWGGDHLMRGILGIVEGSRGELELMHDQYESEAAAAAYHLDLENEDSDAEEGGDNMYNNTSGDGEQDEEDEDDEEFNRLASHKSPINSKKKNQSFDKFDKSSSSANTSTMSSRDLIEKGGQRGVDDVLLTLEQEIEEMDLSLSEQNKNNKNNNNMNSDRERDRDRKTHDLLSDEDEVELRLDSLEDLLDHMDQMRGQDEDDDDEYGVSSFEVSPGFFDENFNFSYLMAPLPLHPLEHEQDLFYDMVHLGHNDAVDIQATQQYNASNAAQTQTAYISSMYANTISSSSSSSTESNLAYTDADAGVGLECGFDSMDVQMIFAEDLFAAEDFVGTRREPLFPSKEYFEDMGYDDQNDLDWD